MIRAWVDESVEPELLVESKYKGTDKIRRGIKVESKLTFRSETEKLSHGVEKGPREGAVVLADENALRVGREEVPQLLLHVGHEAPRKMLLGEELLALLLQQLEAGSGRVGRMV